MAEASLRSQQQYFPALTALRGIAALCVVLFHYSVGSFPNLHLTDTTFFVGKSYLFVDLFFSLSGFILMHVYGRGFADGPSRATLGPFLRARLARLYPLHLVLLGGFVLLELVKLAVDRTGLDAFGGSHTLATLPGSLLLLNAAGLYDTITWNGPSWSISAEWIVGLAFPLLVPVVARLRPSGLLLLYVTTLAGFALLSAGPQHDLDLTSDWGVPRCFLGFVGGMILYRVWQDGAPEWMATDIAALATAAGIVLAMHLNMRGVFVVPLFGLLILCLAQNTARVGRALGTRPMIFLGEISYAVYLAQILLLDSVHLGWRLATGHDLQEAGFSALQSLGVIALMVAALLPLSILLHRRVEVPARGWLRRVGAPRPLRPALERPG
ncbi:acyltransferase [Inquilinus sp. Marseille-Q2685]|uniref:acyltransferase family protein n=1 Tax=Inquilinus sp. Marseille-Q2685 TaxID=2866581 RepID=UPI001CE4A2D4|nr:acyltransferase [Inquilinus sp. Marseille-Q2685]